MNLEEIILFLSILFVASSKIVTYGLYYIVTFYFYISFVVHSIIKWYWILSNALWLLIAMIIFILLMLWITFIYLYMLSKPCILGIITTWSKYMIVLMCFWIWIIRILLRICASFLLKNFSLWFSFIVESWGLDLISE